MLLEILVVPLRKTVFRIDFILNRDYTKITSDND